MIKDTLDLEILHHVQEHYDLSRQVKLAQAELSDKGMVGYLTEHRDGKPVSVDKLETLAKLAAEGRLPDKLNGEFKVLRDALVGIYEKNLQAKVNGHAPTPLSPEMRAHLKEYAKWVLEPDEKGGVKVRALLDDPRWLERNGYKAFQAQEGRHFFRAMTVPERLLEGRQRRQPRACADRQGGPEDDPRAGRQAPHDVPAGPHRRPLGELHRQPGRHLPEPAPAGGGLAAGGVEVGQAVQSRPLARLLARQRSNPTPRRCGAATRRRSGTSRTRSRRWAKRS
jgi:hypothetical protein